MLSKVKKIYLYKKATYKGEIIKKIEYKFKDLCGFFFFRNILQYNKKNKYCIQDNYNILLNKNKILQNRFDMNEEYRIFNKYYTFDEFIKKLNVKKEFWRKIKITQYEDIKVNWEYNRLQVLLPLTIKYIYTKEKKYIYEIEEILTTWEIKNKFEYSLNWNNNLEVAIRAINISLAIILLKNKDINEKFSRLLYLHAKHIYCEIDYSYYCIPNNHVIGEAVSLLFLSNLIDTKENKKWYSKAIEILNNKIDIIDENGISKENSFSYQFFVTKMYILALCFVKEKEIFNKLNNKILKSLDFLLKTIINENEIINYGDNDGGFLYSAYMNYNIAKDIREYYDYFFEKKINLETELIDCMLKKSKNQIKYGIIKKDNMFYSKNIFIYKWNNNLIFFNAKKIQGHAHNDSLAIFLIVNGEEIITDSGTYSYNKSIEKRKYYRERKSHSTIQIKNDKNAIPIGSFRWINKNDSYLEMLKNDEDTIVISGIICNICKRTIEICKKENRIIVNDINYTDSKNIKENWITLNGSIIDNKTIKVKNVKIEYETNTYINENKSSISRQYLDEQSADIFTVEYENTNNINLKIIW